MLEIDGSHELAEGLALVLVFVALSVPIIIVCLFSYLKKRLEHKQIMAAIEKGVPPQQIIKTHTPTPSSPRWIKSLTRGIIVLLIAAIMLTSGLVNGSFCFGFPFDSTRSFIALVLLAIGLGLVIRGLLLRKIESQQDRASKNIPPNGIS